MRLVAQSSFLTDTVARGSILLSDEAKVRYKETFLPNGAPIGSFSEYTSLFSFWFHVYPS
ncbi:hypothetical protein PITCH_A2070002 [uncultured Desulfobacterium sp.]|uniref:Uncharacterized protein n=1 Tax=uncultured Desulfobacterium sp. TaxID=201089 RepID=A0A445MXD4_9BACT|nr:hypothetical protein PITCH_A2070002 [uncultured Desulfobacterium sp.]